MTDKNEEQVKETKTAPAAEVTEQKPAKEAAPKTEPKAEAKTEPKAETKGKEGEGKSEPAEKKRAQLNANDDEIPEDAELLELTPAALKKRLGRATKKELKERFGTDNFEDIKEKMSKLEKLEAAEEERERAKLSEKEKYEKDIAKLTKERDQATGRLQALYDERIIQTEENRVNRLADEAGMDPEYVEDQYPKLAKFLNENYSAKELKKLKDSVIKKWFVDRVAAKPKLAKETQDQQQQQQAKPKVGFTNGGGGGKQPPPADNATAVSEKTLKPGQKNSMSRAEARAEMNRQGYRY